MILPGDTSTDEDLCACAVQMRQLPIQKGKTRNYMGWATLNDPMWPVSALVSPVSILHEPDCIIILPNLILVRCNDIKHLHCLCISSLIDFAWKSRSQMQTKHGTAKTVNDKPCLSWCKEIIVCLRSSNNSLPCGPNHIWLNESYQRGQNKSYAC